MTCKDYLIYLAMKVLIKEKELQLLQGLCTCAPIIPVGYYRRRFDPTVQPFDMQKQLKNQNSTYKKDTNTSCEICANVITKETPIKENITNQGASNNNSL